MKYGTATLTTAWEERVKVVSEKKGLKILMTLTLPQDFRVRHPTLEDADIVVGLFGAVEVTRESTLTIWQTPEVDLARDIWLIFSPGDQLVAYLQLGHEKPYRMQIIIKVHPDYDHLGLQAFLLERAYERAGMHVVRQFDKYEKELRPGIELSVQSLAE